MAEHETSAHSHSWYLLSSTGSNVFNFLATNAYCLLKMSGAFVFSKTSYWTRSPLIFNKKHLKCGQLQALWHHFQFLRGWHKQVRCQGMESTHRPPLFEQQRGSRTNGISKFSVRSWSRTFALCGSTPVLEVDRHKQNFSSLINWKNVSKMVHFVYETDIERKFLQIRQWQWACARMA